MWANHKCVILRGRCEACGPSMLAAICTDQRHILLSHWPIWNIWNTHTHTHTHTHSLWCIYSLFCPQCVSTEANTCTRSSPVSDFNRGGYSEAVAGLADRSGPYTAELILVRCVLPEAEVSGAWGSVFVIQVHCVQVSSHLHGNSTGKAVLGVALQGFQFCQSNAGLAIITCRGQIYIYIYFFFFILDTILDRERPLFF